MNFPRLVVIVVGMAGLLAADRVHAGVEDDEKAETRVQMRRVWEALMAHKKDHGQLPDHLSDLIPDYLPNADALISPTQRHTGRTGDNNYQDPKFRSSFCYEFSVQKFARNTETFRAVKEAQMAEFGGVVPILRCFLYRPRIMNVGYAGDFYESELYWETDPAAKAVAARIGPGPGFANGEFATLTAQDAESGTPIAGAEVRVTSRMYHFLPLPDRTLVTGGDGKTRVPLGPARPPSRRLTVAVTVPGYFAPPETWREGNLPEEAVIGMERARKLAGIVKIGGGSALEGAKITISAKCPKGDDPKQVSELVLETIVTGPGGTWSCDRFPQNLTAVWLEVRHPASWSTIFKTDGNSDWARKAQKDLGDAVRVLSVLPAAPLSGRVTSPEGVPAVDAEVCMMPKVPLPTDCADALPFAELPKESVKTDAQGRYSMTWCDAGKFALMAFPVGGVPQRLEFQTLAGMRVQDLVLAPGRAIEGRVTNEQGEPVAGVQIRLCGWGDSGLATEKDVTATGADGSFSWPTAPMDAVVLRFQSPGFFDRCVKIDEEAKNPLSVRMFASGRR